MTENSATRRNVILGVAAAGAAVPVLAACGSSSDGTTGSSSDGSSSGSPTTAASNTFKTADIPVGSGKIFPDQQVVITQPKAGDFKAFSAVCTHQGCIVSGVSAKAISCGCHFSQYSIEDGHVEEGPARRPLPEKTVTVSGDTLTVS